MRIIIIKFRNIGDVLLTTPLIKNLRLHYPDAQIDMVVNKGTEEMITDNPNLNNIFVYEREFFKKLPPLKKWIKELQFFKSFRDYDMIINTTEGDRGAFIAKFSKAKTKIGYPVKKNILLKGTFNLEMPKPPLMRHTIENNLDAVRIQGLQVLEKKVEIFWKKEDEKKVDALNLGEFVHVHPVSRWLFKCIKDEIMAEIIDFIESRGKKVVLTASPDKKEIEKVNSILSFAKSSPVNLSGKLSLKEVAYLASNAKLFIGVDTAIMHIASAVNTPVIAFFGPSGAFNWGPWDNELTESGYTQKNGVQRMGKNVVIQHNWKCIPCGKDGCNGSKISDCLMQFDMQEVKKIIEEKL